MKPIAFYCRRMVELNPLRVTVADRHGECANKKGRPRNGNIMRFGPQPQSMVSKLLNKLKAESDPVPNHDIISRNPLEATIVPVKFVENRKGRPCKGDNIIRFGNQPQSIVSKLMKKLTAEINQPTEKQSNNDTTSLSPLHEPDQIDYLDNIPVKSKKSSKTRNMKFPDSKPKIFACEFENCKYATKLASNLTKHKRVHTGEKPYLCDRCSFRSNFINSLNVHKRLHTELRPYKCSECTYHCNSLSNLKKHYHCKHKTKQPVL